MRTIQIPQFLLSIRALFTIKTLAKKMLNMYNSVIRPDYLHIWSAQDELIDYINHYIAKDHSLRNYANPDAHAAQHGNTEFERLKNHPYLSELPDTGRFQDILAALNTQLIVNPQENNNVITPHIKHQQSTEDSQLWFAAEQWYQVETLEGKSYIILQTQHHLLRLDTRTSIGSIVLNALNVASEKFRTQNNLCGIHARQAAFNTALQNSLDQSLTDQPNHIQQKTRTYLDEIRPLYTLQGACEVQQDATASTQPSDSAKRQFILKSLMITHPGKYRTKRALYTLTEENETVKLKYVQSRDLRPHYQQNPSQSFIPEMSSTTDNPQRDQDDNPPAQAAPEKSSCRANWLYYTSLKSKQCVLKNSYIQKLLTQRFYLYLSIVIFLILLLTPIPNILHFHITRFITHAHLARLITSILCIVIPVLISQLIQYSKIIRATHKTFDHPQAQWYASSTSADGTEATQDNRYTPSTTVTVIPATSTAILPSLPSVPAPMTPPNPPTASVAEMPPLCISATTPSAAAELSAPSTPPNSPTASAAKKPLQPNTPPNSPTISAAEIPQPSTPPQSPSTSVATPTTSTLYRFLGWSSGGNGRNTDTTCTANPPAAAEEAVPASSIPPNSPTAAAETPSSSTLYSLLGWSSSSNGRNTDTTRTANPPAVAAEVIPASSMPPNSPIAPETETPPLETPPHLFPTAV